VLVWAGGSIWRLPPWEAVGGLRPDLSTAQDVPVSVFSLAPGASALGTIAKIASGRVGPCFGRAAIFAIVGGGLSSLGCGDCGIFGRA
jgi:hypothetical protein